MPGDCGFEGQWAGTECPAKPDEDFSARLFHKVSQSERTHFRRLDVLEILINLFARDPKKRLKLPSVGLQRSEVSQSVTICLARVFQRVIDQSLRATRPA
jgi:hypothetical protein